MYKTSAIIASSTSGLNRGTARKFKTPEKIIVCRGNPVYLLPLVEVVEAIKRHAGFKKAMDVLTKLGFPLHVRKRLMLI